MHPQLFVLMYHYIRDVQHTRFPGLHAESVNNFRNQVRRCKDHFEMATLESALAFLKGSCQPTKDLCLLTFDDGLKEHYSTAFPILKSEGVQGVFFPITSCVKNLQVALVHKNHLMMASMDFASYKKAFLQCVKKIDPAFDSEQSVDMETARKTYPWDDAETAAFKLLINFRLNDKIRHQVLDELFKRYVGEEAEIATSLYAMG